MGDLLCPARDEPIGKGGQVMQRAMLWVLAGSMLLAIACSQATKPNPPLPGTVADMVPADSPLPPPTPSAEAPRRVHVFVSGTVQHVDCAFHDRAVEF